jgi:predicted kinase
MAKPKLYLLVGYPGAGKTTLSRLIAERTGAVHIWADAERHKLFGQATHSQAESIKLYDYLNQQAEKLLAAGHSVVFDTNFNFRSDRDLLRDIAARHGAEAVVIWITIPKEEAKKRAVNKIDSRNGYQIAMTDKQFDAITAKLEPPARDENVIKIDGSKFDREEVVRLLGL